MKRRIYRTEITLTERQLNLLSAIIDSFEEGRAARGGDSDDRPNSKEYQDCDQFCRRLREKIMVGIRCCAVERKIDKSFVRARRWFGGKK